jgi:hypothetical protein
MKTVIKGQNIAGLYSHIQPIWYAAGFVHAITAAAPPGADLGATTQYHQHISFESATVTKSLSHYDSYPFPQIGTHGDSKI